MTIGQFSDLPLQPNTEKLNWNIIHLYNFLLLLLIIFLRHFLGKSLEYMV